MNLLSLKRYEPCIAESPYVAEGEKPYASVREAPNGEFVKLKDVEQLAVPALAREEYLALPEATYPEIDAYMALAQSFLAMTSKGHRDVAVLTASSVAAYMAFLDGKRFR